MFGKKKKPFNAYENRVNDLIHEIIEWAYQYYNKE